VCVLRIRGVHLLLRLLLLCTAAKQDATINAAGGEAYTGMDRFDCRKALWADMEAQV
jgi:valyl-tRNA synthetase